MTPKRTIEEKKEILNRIEEKRKQGLSVGEAAQEEGISTSNYYDWKWRIFGKNPKKNKAPALVNFTPPVSANSERVNSAPLASGRVMVLIGSVSDVSDLMRGMQ
jgi:hypothetical protein